MIRRIFIAMMLTVCVGLYIWAAIVLAQVGGGGGGRGGAWKGHGVDCRVALSVSGPITAGGERGSAQRWFCQALRWLCQWAQARL